jgi:hypothetical protein
MKKIKNKDNPVPSIKLLQKAFEAGANIMYNMSNKRTSWTFDFRAEFDNWKKQNGVETNKEQPKQQYDLKAFYMEQKESCYPITLNMQHPKFLCIQMCGKEVILMPDGKYFINDTTGG